MRKHLYLAMLMAAVPFVAPVSTWAEPVPQQSQTTVLIQGTVLDENNEGVISATVAQKGNAANAVATDAFGNFKIRVPAGATLEVSYVGYKTDVVKAADGMKIYLEPTTEMLNELVAIGYGTQKKANLTGAVATVDVARTMDSRPTADVAKALQGSVPGLTITTANGDISANPTIRVRGVGTLSNGATSNPLIVVDGVPVDDMSFLNPDDIADISVLKDAASSAVYGTRAAFGVILITTKTASTKDRVSLSYNNNFGWSDATVLPTFANTYDQLVNALQSQYRTGGDVDIFGMQYVDLLPLAKAWQDQHNGKAYTDNVELHPYVDENNVGDYKIAADGKTWMRYADWDIAKTLFQMAPSQKHNVSLEGTSGKTQYRLSFGYDSREDLLKYNPANFKRYIANANVSTQIFKWLKAGTRINFSNKELTSPSNLVGGSSNTLNPYQYIWRWPGFFLNYGYINDAEGNPVQFRNVIGNALASNMNKTVYTQTRLNAWAQADITKDITLMADFTYGVTNMDSDAAVTPFDTWQTWGNKPMVLYNPYSQESSYAAQSTSRDAVWTANVYATYSHSFNEAHNLKVMLGWTAEQEEYKYLYAKRTGLTDYNKPNINLAVGDTYQTSGNFYKSATTGFFGRINYDYKGIYLVELNGRYDGSSSFPENDQWAFFPSASAGYRFSEEGYFSPLKDSGVWTNGKVRASYGHIGNDAVGQYRFLSTIAQTAMGSSYWLNGSGQKLYMFNSPTAVASSLTWERIITTDVGLDLGFFNNELNASFDWYQRDTKDMLGPGSKLPDVFGAAVPLMNNGSLQTRGWEISVNWNKSFGDWDVYATASLGDSRTKITKWNNPSGLMYTYDPATSQNYTEGMYYGDVLGFETDRYFTVDDFTWDTADGKWAAGATQTGYAPGIADQTGLQTNKTFIYGPGDIKFVDQNHDGKIDIGDGTLKNHGDLKVIGNALPRYEYSLRLGGAWKGIDLDLFFQGVGKRDMWVTGSTVIPMAQSAMGTFTNQDSYNHYIYNDVNEIIGWQIDQNNKYPNMYEGCGGNGKYSSQMGRGCFNYYPQSRYLLNMAYCRLKNVTVGYTLPVDITKKAYIQRARIYFSCENPFFVYNGASEYQLDPELATSATTGAQGSNAGYADFGRTTPMPRTYSFGIQVTF